MVSYINGFPRAELEAMALDGETMINGNYENFRLSTKLQSGSTGGKWGGLSLSKLMIDANEYRKKPAAAQKPAQYALSETPKTKSSALYLIRMRNANKGYFKIGRAKELLKRLSKYKTALPLDHDIIVISCLVIPDPSLIVAIEKVLIANLRQWCLEYPTQIQPLRRTEWFTRGTHNFGEALVLRTFVALARFAAMNNHPVHMHLFAKAAWNEMLKLSPHSHLPRWDVVNKKWKGLTPIEKQLHEAENLYGNLDDEGFSKKQLAATIDPGTQSVVVAIEPVSIAS